MGQSSGERQKDIQEKNDSVIQKTRFGIIRRTDIFEK